MIIHLLVERRRTDGVQLTCCPLHALSITIRAISSSVPGEQAGYRRMWAGAAGSAEIRMNLPPYKHTQAAVSVWGLLRLWTQIKNVLEEKVRKHENEHFISVL